jgi:hypothetical protein
MGLKPPELTPEKTVKKAAEIMKQHASEKELSPTITRRLMSNFLDELDPSKLYLTELEVHEWTQPTDAFLEEIQEAYLKADFSQFRKMREKMKGAIERGRVLEANLKNEIPPKGVDSKKFRKLPWAKDEVELIERMRMYRGLQAAVFDRVSPELKEKMEQRIAKKTHCGRRGVF